MTDFSVEDWGSVQTVLQFRLFCRIVACVGFGTENTQRSSYSDSGCKFASRYIKLEGENFQEVQLLHFLAKPGAEKA
jgi:hypothetical protein